MYCYIFTSSPSYSTIIQVLHGCRKPVLQNVKINFGKRAKPSLLVGFFKLNLINKGLLFKIGLMRMTSSHYGPYKLGYTCATKNDTNS